MHITTLRLSTRECGDLRARTVDCLIDESRVDASVSVCVVGKGERGRERFNLTI